MKVNIEAETTPNVWRYRYTQDLHYAIYANEQFQTSSGEIIPRGSPFTGHNAWKRVPCVLTGGDTLVSTDFEIDSTEDSPDNPGVRYSAYIFSGNIRITPRLLAFPVPQSVGTLTWDRLTLHRDARPRSRVVSGYYDQPTVEFLIERALASLRYASEIQPGHAASSFAPTNPLFPVHVSITDPSWTAFLAGQGQVAAHGHAQLVPHVEGARVIVPSALVSLDSVIVPFSQSIGVIGSLRAPIENYIEGESFQIISTNGADEGTVGWAMFS